MPCSLMKADGAEVWSVCVDRASWKQQSGTPGVANKFV